MRRLAIVTRGPTTAETAVSYTRERRRIANRLNHARQRLMAGRAIVRADIEVRQLIIEQTRHARHDRMRVEEHNGTVLSAHSLDLCRKRFVIRREELRPPPIDLV